MNITLRQLEIFCAIARRSNVSRAAEDRFISQSAASMALAELEKQLGENLFDRFGKKLELNANGRMLLPKAEDLLNRAEEIEALCHPDHTDAAGLLKAGASSTVGNYLMPSLLGRFAEVRPNIQISLHVGNTEQMIQALLNGEIDIGFIEGICHDPGIEKHEWRTDELVIIASPQHPLSLKRNPSRNDLSKTHWILRERGSGTRAIFERALSAKINNLDIRYELGHTEAIKQAVKNNLGISCLSRLAVQDELHRGILCEIPAPFLSLQRTLYQLLRKGKYLTGSLTQFIRFMQETASNKTPSC